MLHACLLMPPLNLASVHCLLIPDSPGSVDTCLKTKEVFANNTNLTFLYRIDIKGFKKVSAKNMIAFSGN